MIAVGSGMNDYSQIRTGSERDPYKTKLSPAGSIQRHVAAKGWLLEESKVQTKAGRKIVVVTHHLPSFKSIPQHLHTDRLNPAFASDMEADMAEIGAKVWVHGHTHYSADYTLPCGTRVVCNPRGYAGVEENPKFNPKLIISVL